ncbi:MAG: agmatinase [Candidatus Micrarchaeia archaeon]
MKNTFMGIQDSYKDSDIAILSIPYENKLSYRTGTKKGPDEILKASLELEHFSLFFNENICDKIKIHTFEPLKVKNKDYLEMITLVEKQVSKIKKDGKKFAILGGEHSISIGVFEAILKDDRDISVLHLDAHADLKEEYLNSKYSHGCVIKRLLEKSRNFVSVGIRDYAKEEYEIIKDRKLSVYGTEFNQNEIIRKLEKKVYITLDMDVFDPSIVPGVGTPQPEGLNFKQVIDLINAVGKTKEIIGFDMVELSPITNNPASEFLASKLLYNMIGSCFFERF